MFLVSVICVRLSACVFWHPRMLVFACLFIYVVCVKVSAKWMNGWGHCYTYSTVFGPMFVINVLLSGLTVSEGGMHRDEHHSSLLIYWLPFLLV